MTPNITEMQRMPKLDFKSFLAVTMYDYLDYLDHLGTQLSRLAYLYELPSSVKIV